MHRFLITFFLGSIFSLTVLWAAPARRVHKKVIQSDGSSLTLVQNGDEYMHYLTTLDGVVVLNAEDGNYYYAEITNSGVLVSTSFLAHEPVLRSKEEMDFLQRSDIRQLPLTLAKIRSERIASMPQTRSADRELPCMGEQRILLILAQFADLKFETKDIQAAFNKHCNALHYKEEGGYGSVRDYFIEQSRGLYSPNFDIVGPVTLSKNYAYYGANKANGDDLRPGEMVLEACRKAYEQGVDFSNYDSDGDSFADVVFVIYAGHGENEDQIAYANAIWPHQWSLSSALGYTPSFDGVKVNRYACSNELFNYLQPDGKHIQALDGIGTICHEFSHCLGLPDFYATAGNTTHYTMGYWDLMDYGCYNQDGLTPIGYSAYERDFMGWMQLVDLSQPGTYSMNALTEGGAAYRIYNTNQAGYTNEYYILENRQQTGFDSEIFGHGMLVMHVDYDSYAWRTNSVNNNPNHLRMSYIPADDSYKSTMWDLAGDPYPGSSNNMELTDASLPSATVFNGTTKLLGKPITNIRESSDGVITFDFLGGNANGFSPFLPKDNISFQVCGGMLIVKANQVGLPIYIYTLQGQLYDSAITVVGQTIIDLHRGVYLVSVAGKTEKIIIK